MINWYLLGIPAVTAITNRFWRGEGSVPRAVWYAFMVSVATGAGYISRPDMTGDSIRGLAFIWLLYFLGYALFPWQAMFSALHGRGPGRQDPWYAQWMQVLAFILSNKSFSEEPANWIRFGIVYGTIRASLMIPGILLLAYFYTSYIPLIGLLGLGMGLVYYGADKFLAHFGEGNNMAIPLAEIAMGWWHGTYILIAAGSV